MSLPTPNTRKEQYLNAIATGNAGGLPTPITREEEYLYAIAKSGGGGGGTTNYNALDNKPQIAGTTLQGNKSLADLGIAGEDAVEDIYAVMGEMGAKNLISYPYSQTTKTENNVTFTDNGDGTVTVTTGTGGASAYTRFYLKLTSAVFNLPNGRYILSSDSSDSNVRVQVTVYNGSTPTEAVYNTRYGEIPFALGDSPARDRLGVEINIQSGTEVNNLLIKPMIRLASDTDDTYQQYAKTNKQLTDEIANKVDKVEGKGLSTNDYDNTEKGKVADNTAAIEAIENVTGAKNVLPFDLNAIKAANTGGTWSDNEYTIDGVTFQIQLDTKGRLAEIDVSGTPTTDIVFITTPSCSFDSGSYILNGCPSGSSSSSYRISFVDSSYNEVMSDTGEEGTATLASTSSYICRIIVLSGTTLFNAVFKPMIRPAGTDATYVPYAMTNRELTERVNRGSVFVQADSSRTHEQLLNDLYSMINMDKITKDTVFVRRHYTNGQLWYYRIGYYDSSTIVFNGMPFGTTASVEAGVYVLKASGSQRIGYDLLTNTATDQSSLVPSQNTLYYIYY